jgi:hypothetical protein
MKEIVKFGKLLNASEKKKLAGGLRLNCEPNGSYNGNNGFACCSGCSDGHGMCIPCYIPPID